jgi:hypothetical protein
MTGVILHWWDKQKSHTAQARLSEKRENMLLFMLRTRETTDRKVAEV